ncbi:kinase-like protein [Cubamyces menziesii]|nr:kinase-like protein [Cubamyces menziesii]
MASRFIYNILARVVSLLPTKLRRSIWRFLITLGRRHWESDGAAQRIPGGMYVKVGTLVRPTEGDAMRFIAAQAPTASIPIVVDNFTLEGCTWLVMTRIPGYNLAALYPEIPPQVEERIGRQIARILEPIRAIPAPYGSGKVCGFDGGPVYCERLAFGAPPIGPFESVDEFHRALLERARTLVIPEADQPELVHDAIKRAHSRRHWICLTHNDLGAHNVLVDEYWNVTGIIDWEFCAWMPEYWELTKGTFLPQYRKGRWKRIMSAAFPEYPEEQEAERFIVQYRERYA